MNSQPGDRAQGLVSEAWSLLEGGRPGEAALLFGRVLLQDPTHEDARRGLVQARAQKGEIERELEAQLDEARAAAASGDAGRARLLLADVIRNGGDRDSAHELLDRLDDREGWVAAAASPPLDAPARARRSQAGRSGRAWWSRSAFATVCGVAFAAVTTSVAAGWEHLMGRLESRPAPARYVVSAAPLPPAGERALQAARQRLEQGDVDGALAALGDIGPEDPVYPFAVQLRQRAEGARGPATVGVAAPAGEASRR